MAIDGTSLYALKRFGVRLTVIFLFTAVQIGTPWGAIVALQLLLAFNAAICALIAIFRREKFRDTRLGSWDEALALATLCLLTHFLVSAPWR